MGEVQKVPRPVVAITLWWRGRIGLFKRSTKVTFDKSLWHCITGYLELDQTPAQQALVELKEETGLLLTDLDQFEAGPIIELQDSFGRPWTVYTFCGETKKRRLSLNWEHEKYRWVSPRTVPRYIQVSWLKDVILNLNKP